ncbi:MAG: helix-turn-helix domain-containing protein [Terriglobales bacterium]
MEERWASLVSEIRTGGILYSEALAAFRKEFISAALRDNNGNVSKAASRLGLHRNTLTRLCSELRIDLGVFRARSRRPAGSAQGPAMIRRSCS